MPSSANFVLGRFGARAVEVRDALRTRDILVRDRSYEAAGCVRITVGTREQTRRMLAARKKSGNNEVILKWKDVLVFDMDGVLVDVTESYRETIARTVEHFTGTKPTRERIQELKNAGGWNDDWKLSHHMVARSGNRRGIRRRGVAFQQLFLGNGEDGLMLRERWTAQPGTLEKLNQQFRFAVFTGRARPRRR